MIDTYIKCYINNKNIYEIHIVMDKDSFFKQLKENKLMYKSTETGNTEIIYLNKFDRLEFSKDIEFECMVEI